MHNAQVDQCFPFLAYYSYYLAFDANYHTQKNGVFFMRQREGGGTERERKKDRERGEGRREREREVGD